MKKNAILTLFAVLFAAICVNGQEIEEKEAREGEQSIEVQALMLANKNAQLGYENENPIYLMTAAQLMIDFPGGEVELESAEEPGIEEIEPKGTPEIDLDPLKLLEDAKLYAQGDSPTLEMIEDIKEQAKVAEPRGAVGGPYYLLRSVNRKSTNEYIVGFRANELAEVAISGDGDTDLDLFVFDTNGNLIASDNNYSDQCYVSWVPRFTGEYIIVVKNYGPVYNDFYLITN